MRGLAHPPGLILGLNCRVCLHCACVSFHVWAMSSPHSSWLAGSLKKRWIPSSPGIELIPGAHLCNCRQHTYLCAGCCRDGADQTAVSGDGTRSHRLSLKASLHWWGSGARAPAGAALPEPGRGAGSQWAGRHSSERPWGSCLGFVSAGLNPVCEMDVKAKHSTVIKNTRKSVLWCMNKWCWIKNWQCCRVCYCEGRRLQEVFGEVEDVGRR